MKIFSWLTKYLFLQKSDKGKEEDPESQKSGKVIKFGWIEGVYVSIRLFIRIDFNRGYCLDEMLVEYLGGDVVLEAHLGNGPVWDR